jgi:2-oxoisovalerate dehydrogenase E1 component alpha subunit
MSRGEMDELRAKYTQQLLDASKKVREEPQPKGDAIYEHVYAERSERDERRGAPGAKNGVH